MEIIALPAALPGGLDLPALNRRLRAGDVTLDWSAVAADADLAALQALLQGLDLSDTVLNGDTLSEALAPRVIAVLSAATQPLSTGEPSADPPLAQSEPELWQPPEDASPPVQPLPEPVAEVV